MAQLVQVRLNNHHSKSGLFNPLLQQVSATRISLDQGFSVTNDEDVIKLTHHASLSSTGAPLLMRGVRSFPLTALVQDQKHVMMSFQLRSLEAGISDLAFKAGEPILSLMACSSFAAVIDMVQFFRS